MENPKPDDRVCRPRQTAWWLAATLLAWTACSPAPEGAGTGRSPGRPGLEWGATHHEMAYHPRQGELLLEYPFTATGPGPVTIESVTPDCDCMVAPLPRKTFAPGEQGRLGVRFLAGTRVGRQERVIEVRLEGREEPVKLTATIDVAEVISYNPEALSWKVGDEGTAKEVVLRTSEPLRITGHQSSSKLFRVEIEETEPGKTWTVRISPTDTRAPRVSMVMLTTDYPHRPWDRLILNTRIDP